MRIVVVEDNEALANAIAYRLRDRGHAVDIIHDGCAARTFLTTEGADLVVLDITLPGMDGLEVLHHLRKQGIQVPVLLLTARDSVHDRVRGLDAGADDYLVKPFEMDELEARLRALFRRRLLSYSPTEQIGSLSFDVGARHLIANGVVLDLPRKELATLECLLENRGRLVSKAQLADHLYGIGADVEHRAVEPHISRLRKRLTVYGIGIKSARGLGYMLDVKE
ncbi:MAG: response regulator transcription factor [Granulosicoccus sp.]|nr:response regulator transcription factor [Granulosicoccus sp.]